jgi:hypothetical protein
MLQVPHKVMYMYRQHDIIKQPKFLILRNHYYFVALSESLLPINYGIRRYYE